MGLTRTFRQSLASTLAVGLLLALTPDALAETPSEIAAKAAADSWLASTDADRYAQVWQGTASDVKKLTSQREWERMISSQRRPLGRTLSRKLVRILADIDAAIITYQTSFARKKSAAEMLVVTRDSDGKWRISGYEIL